MLSLKSVAIQTGVEPLFSGASVNLYPGQRVGLIGQNGCGKSTLLKAILGEVALSEGEIEFPSDWVVAHVEQEISQPEISALEYVLQGHHAYHTVIQRIQAAELANDDSALVSAYDALDKIRGYEIPQKAQALLIGLGFNVHQQSQAVSDFSGGWQVRLKLAKALLEPSDLLLLDEPTNHLDIEAVSWLEQWLKSYRGTMIVISHDRYFLDQVVTDIAEIDQQRFTLYKGNFESFERQKNERLMQQQALFDKQKQRMQQLNTFIDRFRAKASKAKQAQSRIKSLQRMAEVSAVQATNPFTFEFFAPSALPDPMLATESVGFGYDELLFNSVSLTLRAGDRIGVLGENGSGKTTWLKLLVKAIAPDQGQVTHAKGLSIGYFDQHLVDRLHPEQTPFQHLTRTARELAVSNEIPPEAELKNSLARFGFAGEKALQTVSTFSGGEKARLALALLVFERPNLLVLDEPTNHLDMQTRDALDLALQNYEGSLLLVTHDQHLLSSLVDHYWWVHSQTVSVWDRSLEDYLQLRLQKQPTLDEKAASKEKELKSTRPGSDHGDAPSSPSKKTQRQENAKLRKQLQALIKAPTQKLQSIEKSLQKNQHRLEALHEQMSQESFYTELDKAKREQCLIEESSLQEEKEWLEEEWMLLEVEIEETRERFWQENEERG